VQYARIESDVCQLLGFKESERRIAKRTYYGILSVQTSKVGASSLLCLLAWRLTQKLRDSECS
jgi:hypothetical protein